MKTKITRSNKTKECYALKFLKTLKDSDDYISHKKGEIEYNPMKEILDELVRKGRSGYYSGHDFISLTKDEVAIRKFRITTDTIQRVQEIKCDKKIKQ